MSDHGDGDGDHGDGDEDHGDGDGDSVITEPGNEAFNSRRNLAGFWLLGLCNNFAYVIMLSAAHDILKEDESPHQHNGTNSSIIDPTESPGNRSGHLIPECNRIGTGVILLADIIPGLIIKLTAPWYIQSIPYGVRVVAVTLLAGASFPIVAIPRAVWINIIGVALASASSGLGEITFLSLSSHYHKNSVSTWSSGTGAAGVFGALSYAGLTAAGLTPRTTILIMLVIPVVLATSYFLILVREAPVQSLGSDETEGCYDAAESVIPQPTTSSSNEATPLIIDKHSFDQPITSMTMKQKLYLVKPLLKFMVPLMAVYFAEYFINQALFELIYFDHIWLPRIQQYRWYQVIYQFGVLISRSSVNLVQIKKLWILSVLQFVNIGVLLLQIFFAFLPSIWLVFVIILYEGLLGGAAYVNTFYRITVEIESTDYREFSMGVASLSDTLGIAFSGILSIPFHNFMCTL